MGWNPIETAPLDGRDVLLFENDVMFVGYFAHIDGAKKVYLCTEYGADAYYPSHWMPLPAPPESKND